MRILVIEDEEQLAQLIARVLRGQHYTVDVALDGAQGLDLAYTGVYDAIVLDRMLPGVDGMDVCRDLRAANVETPILFLSARRETPERVEGLEAGADDYLGKPFAFSELLARVRVLTRRGVRPLQPDVLRVGDLTFDRYTHRVAVAGKEVVLSPREVGLLEYLMRNTGQVLSRDQILEHVWGYDVEPEGNTVDLYVHYLRRKLAAAGAPGVIETVRGVGYMIRARS
jgi:two-component system, OmpR family, response regulator